jgi:hypothetical protein
VSHVPAPRDNTPNWMVVASTFGMTEAAIIAGRLESLGIPTYVQRESAALMIFGDGPGAQAKVLVPERYYELAMATLEPDEDVPWLEDGEDDKGDDWGVEQDAERDAD